MAVAQHVDEQVDGHHGDVLAVLRAGCGRHEQGVQERHPREVVRERDARGTGELEQLVGVPFDVLRGAAQHERARRAGHQAVLAQGADRVLVRE